MQLDQLLDNDESLSMANCKENFNGTLPVYAMPQPDLIAVRLKALHHKLETRIKEPAVIHIFYGRQWWRFAAAAVLLFVSCLFWMNYKWTGKPTETAKLLRKQAPVINHPVINHIINQADTVMTILLQDSSIVKLYPKSTISFEEPFKSVQRNINLSGKAVFKVAKNKQRPFTVFAGRFATTALGTAFMIDSWKNNNIVVKLFEGKVVIKATGKLNIPWHDAYLIPGQQLAFNCIVNKYQVSPFSVKRSLLAGSNTIVEKEYNKKGLLVFQNEPLKEIFARLKRLYNLKCDYSEADLKGLFFTGTFSPTDKIENIFTIICDINGLACQREGNSIIIIKKI